MDVKRIILIVTLYRRLKCNFIILYFRLILTFLIYSPEMGCNLWYILYITLKYYKNNYWNVYYYIFLFYLFINFMKFMYYTFFLSACVFMWKYSLQFLLFSMSIMQEQHKYSHHVCVAFVAGNYCSLHYFSSWSSKCS
jgi:hypothetical protein